MAKKERTFLKAQVDQDFLKRLQKRAKEEGEGVSTIVRRAVRNYLNAGQQ